MAGGAPVALIEIFVDSQMMGLAQLNQPRPDVCAMYPDRPGCPNVGFVYSLDTSTLASGAHVLRVIALDSASPQKSASWSTSIVKQ
jgi:hypothetical protein